LGSLRLLPEYETEAEAIKEMRKIAAKHGADAVYFQSATKEGGWRFGFTRFGGEGGGGVGVGVGVGVEVGVGVGVGVGVDLFFKLSVIRCLQKNRSQSPWSLN
jgi:hypothetical protein